MRPREPTALRPHASLTQAGQRGCVEAEELPVDLLVVLADAEARGGRHGRHPSIHAGEASIVIAPRSSCAT